MAAAQGMFSFSAINAADFRGFGVAFAAQLNVWAAERFNGFQELVDTVASLRQGFQELVDAVSSLRQNVSDQTIVNQELVDEVSTLRQSVFEQSVFNQELVNRVALVEINGNGIVERIANWAVQADEKMAIFKVEIDTRRGEINELARQAQGKFMEVASGSESLKSDLR